LPVKPTPAQDRFRSKVAVGGIPEARPDLGPCHLWTAYRMPNGYGVFHPTKTSSFLAHRYAYTEQVGPIPEGMVIDHLCRVRECVNPIHLEPVEHVENLRRGKGYAIRNGMRDSCINGHKYTPENIYTDPGGGIRCRRCAYERGLASSPGPKVLNEIDVDELRSLYESGSNMLQLAQHFKVGYVRLNREMDSAGIQKRPAGRTSKKKEQN